MASRFRDGAVGTDGAAGNTQARLNTRDENICDPDLFNNRYLNDNSDGEGAMRLRTRGDDANVTMQLQGRD